MHDQPELLPFATFAKPHGVRGAIRVIVGTEHLPMLRSAPVVHVAGRRLRVVRVSGTDERPILTLEGVGDRNAAEALRGATLEAPRSAFADVLLAEDEFVRADLVGCPVFDIGSDRQLGVIDRVDTYPANDVLVVKPASGAELLIPFVRSVVPVVDVPARRVEVDAAYLGIDVP